MSLDRPSDTLHAPVAVRTVDLDRPTELELEIDLRRAGAPYRSALLVGMVDGRPVGECYVALPALDRIPADALRALVEEGGRSPSQAPVPISPIPSVSVVVTTCQQPAQILAAVASILSCDPPALEVIVVENRPAGSTVERALIEEFDPHLPIRYIEEPRIGLAAARNAGLRAANGEVVAFTDDDVEVDVSWVGWIACTFACEPDAGCVTGLILPRDMDTSEQVLLDQFAGYGKGYVRRVYRISTPTSRLFPFAAGEFGSGANTALRADVARYLDGFDAALGSGTPARGAEDLDIYIRVLLAGYAVAYEPAAIIWHRHPDAARELRRKLFDYGVSLSAMLSKYMLGGYAQEILLRSPAGVRFVFSSCSRKNVRKGAKYPRSFALIERAGMLAGPISYGISLWRQRQAGYPASSSSMTTYRPIWVDEIEIGAPAQSLHPPPPPDGGRYAQARLLVRRAGAPLGFVDVPLREGRAPAVDVTAQLARQLGHTLKPQPPDRKPRQAAVTSFTVVVCTRGRPEYLRNALESIQQLEHDDFEVLVVDNAPSTLAASDVVAGLGDRRIRYVAEPVAGLSRARNRGLQLARGELVAFTDDDVVVDRAWLERLTAGFARYAGVACVTGLVVPARLDTVAQAYFDARVKWSASMTPRLFDLERHSSSDPLFPYRAGDFGAGANFAVRRSAAAELRFDEALGAGSAARGGEDLDFFARLILAGHTIAYEPSALVWHSHRSEDEALRSQMFAYGMSLSAYLSKHLVTRQGFRLFFASMTDRGQRSGARNRNTIRALKPPIRGVFMSQVAGFVSGPFAYVRGRLTARRRQALTRRSDNRKGRSCVRAATGCKWETSTLHARAQHGERVRSDAAAEAPAGRRATERPGSSLDA